MLSCAVRLLSALFFVSFPAFSAHCLFGCPTGISGLQVEHAVYTLNNNSHTKLANWVAYEVTAVSLDGPSRSRYWRADPLLTDASTLEPDDYKDAYATLGTDRGHLVPLATFSQNPS